MAGTGTRLAWVCSVCQHECIPIRSESRCLCGHCHKEHDPAKGWRCAASGKACGCNRFFYVVAEGAWILRCRCKHKHIDHHPSTHACTKPGCACGQFSSP